MTEIKASMTDMHLVLKLQHPTTDHYEGSDRPERPILVKGTPEYLAAKTQLDADLDAYQAQGEALNTKTAHRHGVMKQVLTACTEKLDEPRYDMYSEVSNLDFSSLYSSFMTQEDIEKRLQKKLPEYSEISAAAFRKQYPAAAAKVAAELREICENLTNQGIMTCCVSLASQRADFNEAIEKSDKNQTRELSGLLTIVKDGVAAGRYASMVAFDFNDLYPASSYKAPKIPVEEDEVAIGPNVKPIIAAGPPPLTTEDEAREERRLDKDACNYYELHSVRQAGKAVPRLSETDSWQVREKAKQRWSSLGPEAKRPYVAFALEHRNRQKRIKEFFDTTKLQ